MWDVFILHNFNQPADAMLPCQRGIFLKHFRLLCQFTTKIAILRQSSCKQGYGSCTIRMNIFAAQILLARLPIIEGSARKMAITEVLSCSIKFDALQCTCTSQCIYLSSRFIESKCLGYKILLCQDFTVKNHNACISHRLFKGTNPFFVCLIYYRLGLLTA